MPKPIPVTDPVSDAPDGTVELIDGYVYRRVGMRWEPLHKTGADRWTDKEFMAWCDSEKLCKYCSKRFVGPSCKCERSWCQLRSTS